MMVITNVIHVCERYSQRNNTRLKFTENTSVLDYWLSNTWENTESARNSDNHVDCRKNQVISFVNLKALNSTLSS